MTELVQKLIPIERAIAKEKGRFTLFALFLREDSLNWWDVVVAAPWIGKRRYEAIEYVAHLLQTRLTVDELLQLSGIFIVDLDDPRLHEITREFRVSHGCTEVRGRTFFDMAMERGFIITSSGAKRGVAA